MTGIHEGRAAIVTGAAGGIGLACAERLAREDAFVAMVDNDADRLRDAAAELAARGLRVRAVAADIGDVAEAQAAVDRAAEESDRLDIVVNAAGIQPYGRVTDTAPDVWDRVLAVNLRAIYVICGRAIPRMLETGGGAIVNIASVQSLASSARVAAYAASKAGVLGLTRSIAVDHGPDGIRANALCPGSVDTPMLRFAAEENRGEKSADEMVAGWGAMHPVGRVGQPKEIAALVSFLAGPEAGFINGAAISIDGGVMAKLGIVLPE